MTDSTQDTVSRVLKSNADQFERKDVQTAAIVGFLLGLVMVVFSALMVWRAEPDEVNVASYITIAYGLLVLALSGFILRLSMKAAVVLFALFAVGFVGMFLQSLLGEQMNIMGMVVAVIWALIVLLKMYPAFGSIRVLVAKREEAPSGVLNIAEFAVLALGVLTLLARIWFEIIGLFL